MGAPSSATVTIADNDSPALPAVSIAATDANASETPGNAGVFTVSRTGSTASALTVTFAVTGTATGADYASIGTSVTIPAGAATRTITVTPVDDTLVEPAETVIVTLTANAAYTLVPGPASATVTISDNDIPPSPDTDGDGMSDAFEIAHGFEPNNPDQDGNGILDGDDDWDGDGILNKNDSTPGSVPVPAAPASGNGGHKHCGAVGAEVLLLAAVRLLRRRRRAASSA